MKIDEFLENLFRPAITKLVEERFELMIDQVYKTMQNRQEDQLLNMKEVMRILKISKPTLIKRMKDGTVPFTRLGRRVLFSKNAVLQVINKDGKS